MRHASRIAAFACASLTLGSLIALVVPTELSTARNAQLDRLSQPKPVTWPGADRVINGQDSYPVTYSPQWLAVAEKAERARLAKAALPDGQPLGYDQPSPQRDAAIEAEGTGEVQVHRGSDQAASQDSDQRAAADLPEG